MSILSKASVAKYIESVAEDCTVEELKTKLSLMFGYWSGYSMSTVNSEDSGSYNSLFNSQWTPFEKVLVALNEIRPVDFELAKSTAAKILINRARLNKGGLANMFLRDVDLDVLDIRKVTSTIVGKPLSVEDMTLFATTIEHLG